MTSKTPEIKIIGAGAPRTGTVSLMKALELLGFGPCYHMDVVQANDLQWPWVDALDGEQDLKKYKALLEGYGSVCDFPASSAYFELMAAYPDAKVILTTRSPETWAQSVMQTIYNRYGRTRSLVMAPWNLAHRAQSRALRRRFFGSDHFKKTWVLDDPAALADALQAWDNRVIASVPADKLLVYKVSEGWEPLCKFLGVPVPSVEFPKANDSKFFAAKRNRSWRLCLLADIAVVVGVASVVAGGAVMLARWQNSQ